MYKEDLSSIKRRFVYVAVLLLLATCIPALCLEVPSWIDTQETNAKWFQRSGSLVVFLAAMAEYIVFKNYDYVSPSKAGYSVPFETPKYYKSVYNWLSRYGLILLVLGTLIWGYGDYIHQKI